MTIQIDKQLHFLCSQSLALIVGSLTHLWWAALISAIVVGALKEVYDKVSGKGSPEWGDFLADCIGAIVGSLIIFIS